MQFSWASASSEACAISILSSCDDGWHSGKFSNSVLVLYIRFSKQAFLQDVPNPHELKDGTPSFKDFMGNRNNRFTNPEAAAKNRIQPPSKCLYYFNAPPKITEEEIKKVFEEAGAKEPGKVKQFPSKCK